MGRQEGVLRAVHEDRPAGIQGDGRAGARLHQLRLPNRGSAYPAGIGRCSPGPQGAPAHPDAYRLRPVAPARGRAQARRTVYITAQGLVLPRSAPILTVNGLHLRGWRTDRAVPRAPRASAVAQVLEIWSMLSNTQARRKRKMP